MDTPNTPELRGALAVARPAGPLLIYPIEGHPFDAAGQYRTNTLLAREALWQAEGAYQQHGEAWVDSHGPTGADPTEYLLALASTFEDAGRALSAAVEAWHDDGIGHALGRLEAETRFPRVGLGPYLSDADRATVRAALEALRRAHDAATAAGGAQ